MLTICPTLCLILSINYLIELFNNSERIPPPDISHFTRNECFLQVHSMTILVRKACLMTSICSGLIVSRLMQLTQMIRINASKQQKLSLQPWARPRTSVWFLHDSHYESTVCADDCADWQLHSKFLFASIWGLSLYLLQVKWCFWKSQVSTCTNSSVSR